MVAALDVVGERLCDEQHKAAERRQRRRRREVEAEAVGGAALMMIPVGVGAAVAQLGTISLELGELRLHREGERPADGILEHHRHLCMVHASRGPFCMAN